MIITDAIEFMPKGVCGFQPGHSMPASIRKKISNANRGRKFPPFTDEHKRKLSESHKGILVGDKNPSKRLDVRKKISEAMMGHTGYGLGKKLSEEVKQKMRKNCCRGENHYNWKGGRTFLHKQIRDCYKYRQWRSDVFTRDNFVCQECGMKSSWIEVHHKKGMVKIIEEYKIKTLEDALNCEELWNINNGRTLCSRCHNKTKEKNYV